MLEAFSFGKYMTKVEVGSFNVFTSPMTVILDDDTINVKAIHFQVCPTGTTGEASTGFTDGVKHRAKSLLVTSTKRESKRSVTYGITHYKDVGGVTTLKLAGKPTAGGLGVAGEFELEFAAGFDSSIPVDFMVIGD